MNVPTRAIQLLDMEARALRTRLGQIKPFAMTLPMVAAASPTVGAQAAIERHLRIGRRELRSRIDHYLRWLAGPGRCGCASEAQRRFAMLRMRFLAVTTQFDVFADALAERSQHALGEWIGGLDALAMDALELPDGPYQAPPVLCYLDRGHGAAIRRARTRLPGGGENPVAIIRVPRERMIGCGIASSLVHEVGHQAAALLDLVGSLRSEIRARQKRSNGADQALPADPWSCFERWISEIIADFWSVARLGIGSTLGLIMVVSLPAPFLFRVGLDEPHPTPWLRVKISIAMGRALFPDPQWDELERTWVALYPPDELDTERQTLFDGVERALPEFAELLANHRPASLEGRSLAEALPLADRTPERLRALYHAWRHDDEGHAGMAGVPPTVAFAAIGQAKYENALDAEEESRLIGQFLRYLALRATIDSSEVCALGARSQAVALEV